MISCKERKTPAENIEADRSSHAEKPVEAAKRIQLNYYRCDYVKNNYDTLFYSGSEHKANEIWGVNKRDIATLPIFDSKTINMNMIISNATLHIKNRYPDIEILFTSYTLERINDRDSSDPKNWFIDVSFLYGKNGAYQKAPVLLDGRIILSNSE